MRNIKVKDFYGVYGYGIMTTDLKYAYFYALRINLVLILVIATSMR